MEELRLQKYLAEAGIASRRKSEEYILQGRVKVNGKIVTKLGTKVKPDIDKIEFDANIASMSYHANYNTRFDFLILGGDYSETSVLGPYFQLSDVNVFDLNLVGDNIPDSLATGMNIHIIAIVDEYDSNSGLFQLVPVETRMRQ